MMKKRRVQIFLSNPRGLKHRNIKQPIRKNRAWPPNWTTIIATLALFASLGQMVFSSPLLTGLFRAPKLIVRGSASKADADVLSGMIDISNEGNAPANKIEIGLMAEIHQQIRVLPAIGSSISKSEDDAFFKNFRVDIERLLPGEHVLIILSPGASLEKMHPKVAKMFVSRGVNIPDVTFVRSLEEHVSRGRIKISLNQSGNIP